MDEAYEMSRAEYAEFILSHPDFTIEEHQPTFTQEWYNKQFRAMFEFLLELN